MLIFLIWSLDRVACLWGSEGVVCRVIEESNMTSVSGISTLLPIPLKYFILRVDSFYPQDITQENMSGHVPCCCHLIYLRYNADASCSTELITFQESRFITLGTITLSLGVIRLPQRISLTSRKCSHKKSLSHDYNGLVISRRKYFTACIPILPLLQSFQF